MTVCKRRAAIKNGTPLPDNYHTQQSKAESRCQTNTKQISNNTAIKSGKPLPNQHQTHFKHNEIKSRTQLPNNHHTKH
jgi:hypothetical protein